MSHYRITDRVLFRGNFSTIFLGLDPQMRQVAIKQILKDQLSLHSFKTHQSIIKELLQHANPHVPRILEIVSQDEFLYIVLELADSSLAREQRKYSQHPYSEKQAMGVLVQLIKSYKFFYNNGVVYRIINPNNILIYQNKYKLAVPSSLFSAKKANGDAQEGAREFEFLAPELLLQNESNQISAKADIFSLGCVLYKMLFLRVPWEYAPSKKYYIHQPAQEQVRIKMFARYLYIKSVALSFPTGHGIHPFIIKLLRAMLSFRAQQRPRVEEIANSQAVDYFTLLWKNKQDGAKLNQFRSQVEKVGYQEPNVLKLYKDFQKSKIKQELKTYFGKREIQKQKNQAARDKAHNLRQNKKRDRRQNIDFESLSQLNKINNKINDMSVSRPLFMQKPQAKREIQQINYDQILRELEQNLDSSIDETKKFDTQQMKDFIVDIMSRIKLKLRAYEFAPKVLKSQFTIPFRFFLLKQCLFEFTDLEDRLYDSQKPFDVSHWQKFKTKEVYTKIVLSIKNQQNMVFDLMDGHFDMTVKVLESSNIDFGERFLRYLNLDAYQNVEKLLKLLLQNMLFDVIVPKIRNMPVIKKVSKSEREGSLEEFRARSKRMQLLKFAVLLRLVVMVGEFGLYEGLGGEMEFGR